MQGCSNLGFLLLCWAAMTTAPASRSWRAWQRWRRFRRRGGQLQLDGGLAGVGGHRQGSLPAILLNSLEDFQQVGQLVSHFFFRTESEERKRKGQKEFLFLAGLCKVQHNVCKVQHNVRTSDMT